MPRDLDVLICCQVCGGWTWLPDSEDYSFGDKRFGKAIKCAHCGSVSMNWHSVHSYRTWKVKYSEPFLPIKKSQG